MRTQNVNSLLLNILEKEPELSLHENVNQLLFRFWFEEVGNEPLGINNVKSLTHAETITRTLRELKHSSQFVRVEIALGKLNKNNLF